MSSATSGLSINIDYFEDEHLIAGTQMISLSGTNGHTTGLIGSDGFMPGCGHFESCYVVGVWNLLPEPSSFSELAGALAGFLIMTLGTGSYLWFKRPDERHAARSSQ